MLIERTIGLHGIEPIWQLRYDILRRPLGQPVESARFAGDELDSTHHFAVWSDGMLLGCASLFLTVDKLLHPFFGSVENEVRDQNGQATWFMLRGMAVAAESQGKGIGKRLLDAIHQWADNASRLDATGPQSQDPVGHSDGSVTKIPVGLWCNARLTAVPFYERSGWKVSGNPFEIANVGPHRAMWRGF